MQLLAHPRSHSNATFLCDATARWTGDALILAFRWQDPVAQVQNVQCQLGPEAKQDSLWQSTCFEAFFGRTDAKSYWELNVSPAGFWNLYRFDDERLGMREETSVAALEFTSTSSAAGFELDIRLPLPDGLRDAKVLRAGLCCVLQMPDKTLSYWALAHTRSQPDFHAPDSRVLLISA